MDGNEDSFIVDLPNDNSELPDEFKDKPYITVYLASALTGRNEEEQELDDKVRQVICDALSKATIRKELCVLKYNVYNPADHTRPGTVHKAEEVYYIDFKALVESDIALFYVNAPSLGVGIERQIAATAAVPSATVHEENTAISRMFKGAFSGNIFTITFTSLEELQLKISDHIARFAGEITDKTFRRRQILKCILKGQRIGERLFKRRVFLNVHIYQIAKSGIEKFWWTALERDTSGVIGGTTLTPLLMCLISEILQAGYEWDEYGIPHLKVENDLNPTASSSLDNLYEAYVSRKEVTDDDTILRFWNEYLALNTKSSTPLLNKAVSKEEWIAKFQEGEKLSLAKTLNETYENLPEVLKKSFDNLHSAALEYQNLGRPLTIDKIKKVWNDNKPHIIGLKRAARMGDKKITKGSKNLTPYSQEDWKSAIENKDLNMHG